MSRTIEAFEGDTLHVSEGPAGLRPADFDALVRFNDLHGREHFEIGHRRIKIRGHVGYVEVGDLAIAILPKADRSATAPATHWRDGLLEMLRVATRLRLESPGSAAQRLARPSLIELVACAFIAELELLMRHGLAKGYRRHESNGPVFRGKLMVSANLRDNVVRRDRFHVEYQTYDHDIAVNRILAAALAELGRCALTPGVAGRLGVCRALFPEVPPADASRDLFARLHLGRATVRYAPALELARMVLERTGPALQTGHVRVFALLFDMSVLWERYVAALFRRAATRDVIVSTQERHLFWCPRGHQGRHVRPDIVLRAVSRDGEPGDTLLVVDTKWKVPKNGQPSDEDLKQMFVYNELLGGARATLLYPATAGGREAVHGPYAGREHRCEQVHLGLFNASGWSTEAMKAQVVELLASIGTPSKIDPGPVSAARRSS